MSLIKTRKMYQLRNHDGGRFGKQIGHKARLLPRGPAMQIAKRLRKSGLTISVDPIMVNTTPEQRAYLDRRYP